MSVKPVFPGAVDAYFTVVGKYLAKSVTRNGYSMHTVDDMRQMCRSGHAHLFVDDYEAPKNALVGQFVRYLHAPAFYILHVGGEGGMDWAEALKELRRFVNEYGVSEITCNPRDGWHRHMKLTEITTLCRIEE